VNLIGYWFGEGDGPVESAWLPIGDLTVIMGANDVGKSRLLRQLEADLVALERLAEGAKPPNALVFAELGLFEIDALLGWTALVGATPIAGPDPEVTPSLPPFDLVDGTDYWLADLRRTYASYPGAEETFRLLESSRILAVEPISDSDQTPGTPTALLHWCCPPVAKMSTEEAAAVSSFVHHESVPDPGLSLEAPTIVARVGEFPGPLLPAPLRLPTDDVRLRQEITETISTYVVANALLVTVLHGNEGIARSVEDHGALRFLGIQEALGLDLWIHEPEAHTVSLSPSVLRALEVITEAAQRACVPFLASRYELIVEPVSIWQWSVKGPVRIRLRALDDESESEGETASPAGFDLSQAADGLRLWAQFAIAEGIDALRLLTLKLLRALHEAAPCVVEGKLEEAQEAADAALDSAPNEVLVNEPLLDRLDWWDRESWGYAEHKLGPRLLRLARPSVYLIDEPERHLNPRLIRETARWLEHWLADHRAQAIVVTHAVGFLAAERACFAHIRRIGPRSELEAFETGGLDELRGVGDELGLDRGELLGTARLLLFVEGETDRVVLDALFRPRLWRAGIVVVPISGTQNHAAVAEADVLMRYCDVPAAVVFDALDDGRLGRLMTDTDARRQALKGRHTESKAMARLLDLAEQNRRVVRPLPLAAPDMFDLLDDEILKRRFPGFPGHEVVNAPYGPDRPRAGQFWADLRGRYGIEKRVTVFREVADEMHSAGRVPEALEALVRQAEAVASEW